MSKISQGDFDTILENIVRQMSGSAILGISGIYEVLAEQLNNDVLSEYETWCTVIVGNVGSIGPFSKETAARIFNEYVCNITNGEAGRAEFPVTMMDTTGEIVQEYFGKLTIQSTAAYDDEEE